MHICTASQRTSCTHLLGCNSSIAIDGGQIHISTFTDKVCVPVVHTDTTELCNQTC